MVGSFTTDARDLTSSNPVSGQLTGTCPIIRLYSHLRAERIWRRPLHPGLSPLHPHSPVLSSRFLRPGPTAPQLRDFGVRSVEVCLMWRKAEANKPQPSPDTTPSSVPSPQRPADAAPSVSPNAPGCVSHGIRIKGEISGQGDLCLDGEFEGKIRIGDGSFTVG